MNFKNKKILLIVGGGISAYKSLDLIRLLVKNNAQVKTVLTRAGKEFVTPLSLTALTKNKVYEEIFDMENESEMDHISLSRWADIIIVLPTTANFMTKLCLGSANDLATTVILASNKDILLVPAMNVRMWIHKATQNNVKTLESFGYRFIGPTKGEMACGEYGEGKMSSPRQIFEYLKNYFEDQKFFKEKKISAIVTTGPTREYIDPVRFISNESSGKQGYEIAVALSKLGIKTTLIAGPTNLKFTNDLIVKKVTSAEDMFQEVKKTLPTDIAICVAAVSDFRPKTFKKDKIKKNKDELNILKLEKNIDILEFLSKNNKNRPKIVVGFSAETENLIENSLKKIKSKYCDFIIANDVSKKNIGLNSDYNKISIISKNGKIENLPKNKKSYLGSFLARKIVNQLILDYKKVN